MMLLFFMLKEVLIEFTFGHIMNSINALDIMNNSNLVNKNGALNFFSVNIEKMSETPYYQKNIYVMLNGAKDYYKSDKVRFREEA